MHPPQHANNARHTLGSQSYSFKDFCCLGGDSYFRKEKFLAMLAQDQLPTGKAVIGHMLPHDTFGMEQEFPQGVGYGLTPEICEHIAAAAPWLLDTAPEGGLVLVAR